MSDSSGLTDCPARVLARDQRGQTLAEYVVLLGVIALVVLVVAMMAGAEIGNLFSSALNRF